MYGIFVKNILTVLGKLQYFVKKKLLPVSLIVEKSKTIAKILMWLMEIR